MRLGDKNGWASRYGYRCAGWMSGFLRLDSKKKNMFYVQQTNIEAQNIPIYLKPNQRVPQKFEEGKPIKVLCRVFGRFNTFIGRYEACLMALDFDQPGITEMPKSKDWFTTVPAGVTATALVPEIFGEDPNKTKIVNNNRSNIVEIAGHAAGFFTQPQRELDNGDIVQKALFIMIAQSGDYEKVIPVRYVGNNLGTLRENIPIGTPLFVRATVRVKFQHYPAHLVAQNGGELGFLHMFIDGNSFGQRDPKMAEMPNQAPTVDKWPTWALDLYNNREDAVKKAFLDRAKKELPAPAEPVMPSDDELEKLLEEDHSQA